MKKTVIPHNRPSIDLEETLAATRVLQSGWLAQGEEVAKFEDDFCNFLRIKQGSAVAVSSGTAALYVALLVLGAAGKKVAIPSFTCNALENAVSLAGGESVFIDSSKETPNMDVKKNRLKQIL